MIYSQYRQKFWRAGQLDYPPSIEHPRHFPRGRGYMYPGCLRLPQRNRVACLYRMVCPGSPPVSFYREALWERVEAGSGSLGAASSESAAGSGRFRACPADVEPATVSARSRGRAGVSLGLDGCEVCLCVPCARVRPRVPCVSRVCPGSPRCLFTGFGSPRSVYRYCSSAAPLAGGPGRSASSLLRLRRRQPSVSGARLAPAPCSTRGPS